MSDTNELRAVKLTELLERCEKATGPDRELDQDLFCDLGLARTDSEGFVIAYAAPRYTSSIDASLDLVEKFRPGFGYLMRRHETSKGVRSCCSLLAPCNSKYGDTFEAWADTSPLAIIIILLRVLSTSDARAPSVEEGSTHG